MADLACSRRRTCGLVLVVALAACGDDDGGTGPADASRDARSSLDLGPSPIDMGGDPADAARDGAVVDAAGARDADLDGAADAAAPDDAGTPDAAPLDEGVVRDAIVSRPDAAECDLIECFRPYVCVRACGEEPFYVGCCACPEGSIDSFIDCRPDAGPGLGPGEPCGGDRGMCGAGLSCCYPCGIPGCDNLCEPTCDESTPGCAGGCLLRP